MEFFSKFNDVFYIFNEENDYVDNFINKWFFFILVFGIVKVKIDILMSVINGLCEIVNYCVWIIRIVWCLYEMC